MCHGFFTAKVSMRTTIKTCYLFLLASCLVACVGNYQTSSSVLQPANTEVELQKNDTNTLRRIISFKILKNGNSILDDRVSNMKVKGVCSNGNGTETVGFEHIVVSNRAPVGALFPSEFLLRLFKSFTTYNCDLVIYPLDEINDPIHGLPTGTVNVTLNRHMNFGIDVTVLDRKPSMGFILDDIYGGRIFVDDIPSFEDPRDQIVLSIICDNGEELLRRQGVYSTDITDLITGGDMLVNVFTKDLPIEDLPARSIYIIKDWLGESDSHCIITNSIEGSPYLLWSHVIDYIHY